MERKVALAAHAVRLPLDSRSRRFHKNSQEVTMSDFSGHQHEGHGHGEREGHKPKGRGCGGSGGCGCGGAEGRERGGAGGRGCGCSKGRSSTEEQGDSESSGPKGRGRGCGSGGPRAGRGDIRNAVLMLLQEQPMHGYQLIQEIAQRSGNRWTPSPGAIYPALSFLEDEGLIAIEADSGRKLATLTPAGTTYVEANLATLKAPWDAATGRAAHPTRALRDTMMTLGDAIHQIARTGTEQQAAQAVSALETARRELYLILAGETVHSSSADDAGPTNSVKADASPTQD